MSAASASSATPAPASTASTAEITALQAAAESENVSIYGYSLAGAHLRAVQRAAASSDYDAHRAQLLVVAGWLQERSATVPPAAPEYRLPYPVTDAASAQRFLAAAEEAVAAAYADLVAASSGALQRSAGLALQAAAVRELRWSGSAAAFPGLTGRLPGTS